MNKTNKTNGNLNLDTPEMLNMRQAVVEQELSSRSWKAYYEKMYFSLEAEKIEPEYREYQKRTKKRLDEEKTQMEEFMKAMQVEMQGINEQDPNGEVELTPVTESEN